MIDAEFGNAKTVESRVVLLAAFKMAMDGVEPTAQRSNLATFRAVRLLQYDALLMREAMADKGDCTETLDRITKGEIAAGRMASDSALRKIAEDCSAQLRREVSADAKRSDPWASALGWLAD